MRALFLILLAMAFYAAQNVIIDQKLRSIQPVFLTAAITGIVCLVSVLILVTRQVSGLPNTLPTGGQLLFVLLAAILVCSADIAFFNSYNAGASLALATTAPITLPLFAWLISFAFTRQVPTPYELVGWCFAGMAVFMMSRGKN